MLQGHDARKILESDFSKFDKSQEDVILGAICIILLALGMTQAVVTEWEERPVCCCGGWCRLPPGRRVPCVNPEEVRAEEDEVPLSEVEDGPRRFCLGCFRAATVIQVPLSACVTSHGLAFVIRLRAASRRTAESSPIAIKSFVTAESGSFVRPEASVLISMCCCRKQHASLMVPVLSSSGSKRCNTSALELMSGKKRAGHARGCSTITMLSSALKYGLSSSVMRMSCRLLQLRCSGTRREKSMGAAVSATLAGSDLVVAGVNLDLYLLGIGLWGWSNL